MAPIKIILDEKCVDITTLKMTWGSPYEVWLLSTIMYNESSSTPILPYASDYQWATSHMHAFFTQWGAFEYKDLHPSYFIFTNTQHYSIID